ncbi:DUF6538 domain-containing protein [Ancylobacter moscoviensis]
MARRGRWLKQRGAVWWFQLAVPTSVQSIIGKAVIQESLRTSDRKVAEHLALEKAATWKRTFDLHQGAIRGNESPRNIFLEVQQRIAWLKGRFKNSDELDVQLDLLWDEYAAPELRRLRVDDLSEADDSDLAPEVVAALEAIRRAREGREEVPKEYGTPFSQVAADFISDRQRDRSSRLTLQTVSQMEVVYRLFRDHIEDAPLVTVNRKTVTTFFDKVKRLSPNWGRSPQTKSRTLDQLLATYGTAGGSQVSNRTVNRYSSALYGLWEWARNRDDALGENPFDGQSLKVKTPKDANAPWSEEALKAVLALEISPGIPGEPTPLHWLPRIALLSGMRLNEICSLEAADIQEADGVRYFNIPAGKTESSVRVVPIHSGLHAFLELCPPSGFLFPNLTPGGPDRKRSWYIGRDFGRSTKKIEGRSTFHGFRKNVVETFERSRIPETEVAQIVGHGKKGLTYRVYSPNGLTIRQKQELVELLRLPA